MHIGGDTHETEEKFVTLQLRLEYVIIALCYKQVLNR